METERVNAQAGALINAPELFQSSQPQNGPSGELDKDAFLKLLVAQMRYQDPLDPSSSEEFISTTAQFTVVEKLDQLTKQGENTALVNSLTTASSLVGREVSAIREGVPVTAIVEQSRIVSGVVQLETSAGSIGLGQIVSVGAVPPPPTPVAAPSAAPATDEQAQTSEVTDGIEGEIEIEGAEIEGIESDVANEDLEIDGAQTEGIELAGAEIEGAEIDSADTEGALSDGAEEGIEIPADSELSVSAPAVPIDSAEETVSPVPQEYPLEEPVLVVDQVGEPVTAPPAPIPPETVEAEIIDPIEAVQPIETPAVPEVVDPLVQAPEIQTDIPAEAVATNPVEVFEPAEPFEPIVTDEAVAIDRVDPAVPESDNGDVDADLDVDIDVDVDAGAVPVAEAIAETVQTLPATEVPTESDVVIAEVPQAEAAEAVPTAEPATPVALTEISEATDPEPTTGSVAQPIPEVTDPFDPFEQIS